MANSKSNVKDKKYGGIANFIKGLIVSFIITFACILIFAFVIKWFNLGDNTISPVNLGIKTISVAIGSFIFAKKSNNGLLKGAMFGFVYTFVAFVLFSLLAGTFSLNMGLVLDILCNMIIGAIMGIIGVNQKK